MIVTKLLALFRYKKKELSVLLKKHIDKETTIKNNLNKMYKLV